MPLGGSLSSGALERPCAGRTLLSNLFTEDVCSTISLGLGAGAAFAPEAALFGECSDGVLKKVLKKFRSRPRRRFARAVLSIQILYELTMGDDYGPTVSIVVHGG